MFVAHTSFRQPIKILTAELSMKIAHVNSSKTMQVSIAVALVLLSPGFICAEGDEISPDNVVVLQIPPRIQTAETNLNKSFVDSGRDQAQTIRNDTLESRPAQQKMQATDVRPAPVQPVFMAITRSTSSAKRAAAMRLTDTSQNLLRARQYEKAVSFLEKALSLEASPYVYFYLARAHYGLGHYQAALNFLEVAESWLDQQPDWMPQLAALKAEIPGSGITQQSIAGQIALTADQMTTSFHW